MVIFLIYFFSAILVDNLKTINKFNIKKINHPKQSLNIRNTLNPNHKRIKPRFRSPRLEIDDLYEENEFFYNNDEFDVDENLWFVAPLSTPAVLSTLTHWLHGYDKNSTEATSLMEMMGWQEMVAIKDRPGFHLSIGLCTDSTIRAIAQFQSVHSDKKNLLLIKTEEEMLEVQPLTIRAIATSINEDLAVDILLDIFSTINSGPFILNGKNVELANKPYINFNWNRLRFVPRLFLATVYKCVN